MMKRIVSGIVIALLLVGMLTFAFNIKPVKSEWTGTVYIRADGSIDPPDAPIHRVGDVYTFTDNIYASIVVERSNIIIDGAGYTLKGTGSGIGFNLSYINNVTIKDANIKNFFYCVCLNQSSNNKFNHNNITHNYAGIGAHKSYNNVIVDNIIAECTYGLLVGYFDANILSNNVIRGNHFGVWLCDSELNTFRHNAFVDNDYSLEVWASIDLLDFCQDIDVSNVVNGKPIYYLVNQHDMIIEPSTFPNIGYLALVNSTNILVKDLNLQQIKSGQGILLGYCENVLITNATISDCNSGVYIGGSHKVQISENFLFNNENGITVIPSSRYLIKNNTIVNNLEGINIYQSCGSSIIQRNIIKNNGVGIRLSSGNHTIVENTIEKSTWIGGIVLLKSSLWYDYTQPNYIYHNNIIDNTPQVYFEWGESSTGYIWDDGYPSGGNYWSDHSDIDLYSGPYQNETGSDGIWDHPYVIDANNKDRYPFVNPWTPTPPIQTWSFDSDFQYNLDDDYGSVEGSGHLRGKASLSAGSLSIEGQITLNGLLPSQVPEFYLVATDGQDRELAKQAVDLGGFSYRQIGPNTYNFTGKIPDVTPPINNGHYEAQALITYNANKYDFLVNTLSRINTHYFPLTPLPAPPPPVPTQPPQPINIEPPDGATDVSLTPELISSPPLSDVDKEQIPWEEMDGFWVTRVDSQWQITTVTGDYSNPVFDSTLTDGLIDKRFFPDLPDAWANWVPSGVLDYDTTYYWRVRHMDFRGVWSPWSEETSFTTRKFIPPKADFDYSPKNPKAGEKVELDASASFPGETLSISYYRWDLDGDGTFDGLTTSPIIYYRWDKSDTYKVTLEVVNSAGDRNATTKEITVERNPQWEGFIGAVRRRIFGPKGPTEEDWRRFEIIKRELRLEEFDEFYDSTTPTWVRDMQILMALKEKIPTEEGEITYEEYILQVLHDMALVDSYVNYQWGAQPQINEYFTNMAEVNKWAELILIIAARTLPVAEGIILMIPKVVQAGISLEFLYKTLYERERWLFFNDYYDQSLLHLNAALRDHLQALKDEYAEPLRTRGEEFKQEVREKLRSFLYNVLEKYKLLPVQAYQKKSPVELRVYDSHGNVTGLVDGIVNEGIIGSAHFDGTVLIYPASDTYYFTATGTDQGVYGITVISVMEGVVLNFTATDIPTSANAIHQYSIDWEALALGEEGVTVTVDSDGDGTFEHTFTSDSELTHDEFMLQTATIIDFDPDTLNLKSKGSVITVYIEFPEGYDVADINVSTIMLNRTVPAKLSPTAIGDYDNDTVPDLMVKFDRAELISYILANVNVTQLIEERFMTVTLTITGKLNDGTAFQGSTTITIILPMPRCGRFIQLI